MYYILLCRKNRNRPNQAVHATSNLSLDASPQLRCSIESLERVNASGAPDQATHRVSDHPYYITILEDIASQNDQKDSRPYANVVEARQYENVSANFTHKNSPNGITIRQESEDYCYVDIAGEPGR